MIVTMTGDDVTLNCGGYLPELTDLLSSLFFVICLFLVFTDFRCLLISGICYYIFNIVSPFDFPCRPMSMMKLALDCHSVSHSVFDSVFDSHSDSHSVSESCLIANSKN